MKKYHENIAKILFNNINVIAGMCCYIFTCKGKKKKKNRSKKVKENRER